MGPEGIKEQFVEAKKTLDDFLSNEKNFVQIENAGALIVNALKQNKKIISCGNGGSMCDAMHFAEELSGRFRENRRPFAALSLSDASAMSCIGNDYGYQYVFSRQIEALGCEGDVLLAISTSGNSENIVNAIATAKEKKMHVIALTGKDGGRIKTLCDIELRAPHSNYADRAQEIHIKIIHSLIFYTESCF